MSARQSSTQPYTPYQVTRFTAEDTQKFREQTCKAVAETHARAAWIKKNQ